MIFFTELFILLTTVPTVPVVKTDFNILEKGKRDNAHEKNFFLHHCFEAFEALPKVVP